MPRSLSESPAIQIGFAHFPGISRNHNLLDIVKTMYQTPSNHNTMCARCQFSPVKPNYTNVLSQYGEHRYPTFGPGLVFERADALRFLISLCY